MSAETLRNMLVKQEPRTVVCCFVCAGVRAEFPIYSKPCGERPFFPFLEHHSPPDGAENITVDGRVVVCSLCYMFLMKQWESYERSKTPHSKRIYWLKRLDNGPFAGMEMNLQQDYESLFDGPQTEVEPRPKQRNRNATVTDGKKLQKYHSRSESCDSSVSNASARCEKSEVPESSAINVLDLSMPSRVPSQSCATSSTPVPEACYICGTNTENFINVFAKPILNCPFFPTLLFHPKPSNARSMDDVGKVHSCENCHRHLLVQWDLYQRHNVPHNDRYYSLKPENAVLPVFKQETNLDKTFVCFTCGTTGHVTAKREISSYPEKEGELYFSFLTHVEPSNGAEPLHKGKAVVCSLCYKSLFRQLRVHELSNVPEECRKYKIHNDTAVSEFSVLRQHLKGSNSHSKSSCYLCSQLSESLLPVSTVANGHMYFPFIRSIVRPPNTEALSEDGFAKVCYDCYSSLKYQWNAFEHAKIPISQRQYRIANFKADVDKTTDHNSADESNESGSSKSLQRKWSLQSDVCCLCIRPLTQDTMQILETVPRHDRMHFPFVRNFIKAEEQHLIDQYGRVPVCTPCYSLLKNQWDMFETSHIPHAQRQYRFYVSEHEPKPEPVDSSYHQSVRSALHVHVPSPELKIDVAKNAEPLLTTVNTLVVNNMVSSMAPSRSPQNDKASSLKVLSTNEDVNVRTLHGPLDAPMGRPLLVNAACFVCAEPSSTTPMYAIHSQPFEKAPFFPFLAKRCPPDGAEKLAPNGDALVCIFCYHSLLSQFLAYDMSPFPDDANPWQRAYNLYNYVCYICGVTTYRQRTCSISVRDFPFLSEHPRPLGALSLVGGDCVITCLTCFESLTLQWKDFERMKVPVNLRKYNWMVFPPPPDDEKSRGCQILPGQESSNASLHANEDSLSGSTEMNESGLSHGSKPPHVPVQTIYTSKPSSRAIVSPGVHQNLPHGPPGSSNSYSFDNSASALNATRTSSFAAALRKLAKQAVDPIAERDSSPICSPVPPPQQLLTKNHSSGHPHHHHPSSRSVVSVSPTPSHIPYELDKRKEYSRYSNQAISSSRSSEPLNFKSEYSKHISHEDQRNEPSHDAKRSPLYSSLSQYRDDPNALSLGFQPFRNSEDSAISPQMYQQPSGSSGSSFPYRRQLYPPSSSAQNYRLEEPVYLERYGLLRPSAVSYPPATNVIPSYPGMPFYPNNRYPPGLLTQASSVPPNNPHTTPERSRSDERYSERELMRSRDSHVSLDHERSMFQSDKRDHRESDLSEADDKIHRLYSPLSLQINSSEPPGRRDIYGNSHDMLLRKHSPPPSSAPLNLVKHAPSSSSPYQDEVDKWKSRHYSSNGQNSNPNNPMLLKNGFESGFESKFHAPPPPPLISEGSQEYQYKRSQQKMDDLGGERLLLYSKSGLSYSNREYTRTLSETEYQRRSPIAPQPPSNGIVYQKSSESLYDKHKNYREMAIRISVEEEDKFKTLMRNGTLPAWNTKTYSPPERLQRSEEYKTDHVPMERFFSEEAQNQSLRLVTKDTSITRALLQNQITPSIIEKYIHSTDEPIIKVTSKIDQRERRLRKLRDHSGDPDCELSDSESDEEEITKLKEFLVITKGPSLELEVSPQKLGFFKTVGLTTRPKRQYLEWKKYVKRRKMLREFSCSPVKDFDDKVIDYDATRIVELSKRLSAEDDSEQKRAFLHLLRLTKVDQDGVECMDTSESRNTPPVTSTSSMPPQEDEIPEYHFKKKSTMLNRSRANASNDNSAGEGPSNTGSYKKSTSSPSASKFASIPPLIRNEPSSTSVEPVSTSSKSVLISQDPRSRFLNRAFAQEFHESVLQATQIQLGQQTVSSTPDAVQPKVWPSAGGSMDRISQEDNRTIFKWPGIEALMESYEVHTAEQSVEKEFLIDSLEFLCRRNQEFNAQIVCLGQKTSELAQKKAFLDVERASVEKSLDNLKRIFNVFR